MDPTFGKNINKPPLPPPPREYNANLIKSTGEVNFSELVPSKPIRPPKHAFIYVYMCVCVYDVPNMACHIRVASVEWENAKCS